MVRVVERDFVLRIYNKLITRTFHARAAGAESTLFKEKNTSRYAENAVDTALREA